MYLQFKIRNPSITPQHVYVLSSLNCLDPHHLPAAISPLTTPGPLSVGTRREVEVRAMAVAVVTYNHRTQDTGPVTSCV